MAQTSAGTNSATGYSEGYASIPKDAAAKIMGLLKDVGKKENGWTFFTKTGIYGTDYLDRAFITAIGLGANRPLLQRLDHAVR